MKSKLLTQLDESSTYDWIRKSDRSIIYSAFRAIIRAAMLNDPKKSPVEGDEMLQLCRTSEPMPIYFKTCKNFEVL